MPFEVLTGLLAAALADYVAARPVPPLSDADGAVLIELIDRHRVAGLAARGLSHSSAALPADVVAAIEGRARDAARRTVALAGELVRLTRVFKGAGIPMLALKGPALGVQALGDPVLRGGDDLDLLTTPDAAVAAEALLIDAGYQPFVGLAPLGPVRRAAFMAAWSAGEYVHSKNGTSVDLHWRWSDNPRLLPPVADAVWRAPSCVELAGERVVTLPRPEHLAFIAAHGGKHGWGRLQWLCDLPPLLASEEVDLEDVTRRFGVGRPLAQGAVLCSELLGAPLPPILARIRDEDDTVGGLLAYARAELGRPTIGADASRSLRRSTAELWYKTKLRKEPAYKLRWMINYSVNDRDIPRWRLPDVLFPLYFVARPFMWLSSRRRALMRRSSAPRIPPPAPHR